MSILQNARRCHHEYSGEPELITLSACPDSSHRQRYPDGRAGSRCAFQLKSSMNDICPLLQACQAVSFACPPDLEPDAVVFNAELHSAIPMRQGNLDLCGPRMFCNVVQRFFVDEIKVSSDREVRDDRERIMRGLERVGDIVEDLVGGVLHPVDQ